MSDINEKDSNIGEVNEEYSLNDDRRVKVLSPGMLVFKRFIRNKTAVVGMSVLIFMFLFSFLGGILSPYGENQFFYTDTTISKDFAYVTENDEFRYAAATTDFSGIVQAQAYLAVSKGESRYIYKDVAYDVAEEGEDLYSISLNGEMIGLMYKDIISANKEGQTFDFDFIYNALKAYSTGAGSFTADGEEYTIDDGQISKEGADIAYISRYVVEAIMNDVFLSKDFKEKLIEAIEAGESEFVYTDENLISSEETEEETGEFDDVEGAHIVTDDASGLEDIETETSATATYEIVRGKNHENWAIKQDQSSRQYDTYARPGKSHWLGTDKYGMDMLTRLMYGGRVSLLIGFIVIIIETVLGVILGGIAGFFGGWVDNLIMRLVDIFYCIPSMPVIIILGAAMDAMRVDSQLRMVYLMLILGILGWAGIARLVRGQILYLREQEFMTAAEATGIKVRHRIFRHLVPNVIPQLIVNCTMGLGSVIITEATLSFLGLGVKFPFASWGNIINDVNNTHVLTNYLWIWIPAGVLLLATVLAFNLVGDGLRDAFDPKMKR